MQPYNRDTNTGSMMLYTRHAPTTSSDHSHTLSMSGKLLHATATVATHFLIMMWTVYWIKIKSPDKRAMLSCMHSNSRWQPIAEHRSHGRTVVHDK